MKQQLDVVVGLYNYFSKLVPGGQLRTAGVERLVVVVGYERDVRRRRSVSIHGNVFSENGEEEVHYLESFHWQSHHHLYAFEDVWLGGQRLWL